MRSKLPLRKPRSRAKDGPAFVFVDTTENDGQGEDARALVRRQAARSGRKNQHSKRGGSTTLVRQDASPQNQSPRIVLSPQPSYTGYEALRIQYNFDITSLTTFTDIDLGSSASSLLQEQPNLLSSLLRKQSSSFLSYLPGRYGSSPCLDDAMRCLSARAGQMFGVPIRFSTMTALYGKALKSLLLALTNGTAYMDADVYCATRLLTLYELISRPEANHWVIHNKGGINLIEMRGPANHQTRFDWMLLKSQGPSIVVDEVLRMQHSIFEAHPWQDLFAEASRVETDLDSSLWWDFFALICFIPGIFTEMRELEPGLIPPSEFFTRSSDILRRANWIRDRIHAIHDRYQQTSPYPPSLFDLPVASESPDRIRLRGFFILTLLQICRVLSTISVTEEQRAAAEAEAQKMAEQVLLIQKTTVSSDPAMSWYLEQRTGLALAIIRTGPLWSTEREHTLSCEISEFLASRWWEWVTFKHKYLQEALES
ncbi:hypothetical protein BJX99DRAFT_247132 [Aspergillus californicus]